MHISETLEGQIAQRLFGWTWGRCSERCPYAHEGYHTAEGAHVWRLPAYTTDPAATARVWQWVETRGMPILRIQVDYDAVLGIECIVQCGRLEVDGWGATWPEALCRAALALAERMEHAEWTMENEGKKLL
jgi:hypothetical protein